jgi:hypothetical protein
MLLEHKAIEEGGKISKSVERKNMRNVLVWSHDNDTALEPINAAYIENVVSVFQVRAEHLLVVAEPVATLPGNEESGHGLNAQLAMTLLKHCTDIDYRVDIRASWRISANWR